MDEQNNNDSLQALAKYYLEKSTKLEQDFVLYKLQSDAFIESLQQQISELTAGRKQSSNKSD